MPGKGYWVLVAKSQRIWNSYLALQKFVHCDLAKLHVRHGDKWMSIFENYWLMTCNLCRIDRNGVIRVAVFGLTEDLYSTNHFH